MEKLSNGTRGARARQTRILSLRIAAAHPTRAVYRPDVLIAMRQINRPFLCQAVAAFSLHLLQPCSVVLPVVCVLSYVLYLRVSD